VSEVFGIEFEADILAQALRSTDYLKQAASLLERAHFASPQHSWIWTTLHENWTKFGERAPAAVFIAAAHRDFPDGDDDAEEERRAHLTVFRRLITSKPAAPRIALEQLRRFVMSAATEEALKKSIDALGKGRLDDAVAPLRELVQTDFKPKAKKVVDWIEEFEARQVERKRRRDHPDDLVRVPTGITRLDHILSGGHGEGEVGLVVGTTGRGKSIMLTNFGYSAIKHRYASIYLALEMPADQIASRFDSRWSKFEYKRFKTYDFTGDDLKKIDALLAKAKLAYKNKLRIVSMPVRSCDVNTLRGIIQETRAVMDVKCVLVDSGDHMQSTLRVPDVRLQHADIYWSLKALAEEEGVALWSSTHAGKEWEKRVAGAESVAESYDKARIADTVFTLNRPERRTRTTPIVDDDDGDDGKEDEGVGKAPPDLEGFLAKYRDGESKIVIPLDTDLARMMIKQAEREGGSAKDFGEA
jgi:replicative DNA helicase